MGESVGAIGAIVGFDGAGVAMYEGYCVGVVEGLKEGGCASNKKISVQNNTAAKVAEKFIARVMELYELFVRIVRTTRYILTWGKH